MRSFLSRGGGLSRGGAILLPRQVAARGVLNWPRCALCMRAVDAYGIENETAYEVVVWARCSGIRIDPQTGVALHGAPKVHDLRKDAVTIKKGIGWSAQRFTDAVSRLALFAPTGETEFQQDLSSDGVHVVT